MFDITLSDDEWKTRPLAASFHRAASVGSWGVTSIGRGFNWNELGDDKPCREQLESNPEYSPRQVSGFAQKTTATTRAPKCSHAFNDTSPSLTPTTLNIRMASSPPTFISSPTHSPSSSPHPSGLPVSLGHFRPPSRPHSSPRPRRRSSRQRVSLIAGRVSIAPMESPSPPILRHSSCRSDSSGSFLNVAINTRVPSPAHEKESFIGGRRISDFLIEGEIGRGAYGLVKRSREIYPDGSLGVSLFSPFLIMHIVWNASGRPS